MGRRVLIYSIYYYPEQTGIAPYTTALAEHLLTAGWEVTLVAGMPHYPQWQVHETYKGRLRMRESVNGVDTYRFRNWIPTRQTALSRIGFEATFLASALTHRTLRPVDAVIGVTPSFSGCVLALTAGRKLGAPVGLIVQDLMGKAAAQSGISGGRRLSKAVTVLEGSMFRRADQIAYVSERFRPYLLSVGVSPDRLLPFPNWAHVGQGSPSNRAVRQRFGWDDSQEIILHAGTIGLKQGLDIVVDAAELAVRKRPSLLFVLMGDGSERDRLARRSAELPNIRFLPVQPAEQFAGILAAASVLLVSERMTNVDMSLPSKLTSYFASGRPVLAAVNPQGATADEMRRSGGGLVVDARSPDAILNGSARILDDDTFAAALVSSASSYASRVLDPAAARGRIDRLLGLLTTQSERTRDLPAERRWGRSRSVRRLENRHSVVSPARFRI